MTLIKRFGESLTDPQDKWREDEAGTRERITEEQIDAIWWKWVISPGVDRADADGYTIFVFAQPTQINQ